jgi:calcium-dependent protein kinase
MKFKVFQDEEDPIVPEEKPECESRCGRRCKNGFDRLLRSFNSCCSLCSRSCGSRHTETCDQHQRHPETASKQTECIPKEALGLESSVMERLTRIIQSTPDPGVDLDQIHAKLFLDSICQMNMLPCLDEKRFVLVFSRFVNKYNYIPAKIASKFIYKALNRIKLSVDNRTLCPVPRYFFVFKRSDVEKHYRFRATIGRGSFGVVHRVVHLASGQVRVCKSIPKTNSSLPTSQLEAEIRIIAQLDHPNVIRMHEFFEDNEYFHIIMENCRGGDLLTWIKDSIKASEPIPMEAIRGILRQLLRAVAFMNSKRVIHKDLKPENIMLVATPGTMNLDPVVKVIDFGLSELFSNEQAQSNIVAGTAFYMAPEIFRPPFNHKCDVWACGIIAFFLATGFLPFFGSTVAEVKSNVLYRRLQWPSTFAGSDRLLQLSQEFKVFVEKLLEKDVVLRPSAVAALSDPWLKFENTPVSCRLSREIALNIIDFSRLSFLRRSVLNMIAHMWHFSEFKNIIAVFSTLDERNEGMIAIRSLAESIKELGFKPIDSWRAARSLDLSGMEAISYTSFTAGVILPLIDSHEGIAKCAFDAFAPGRKDSINIESILDTLTGCRSALPGEANQGSNMRCLFLEDLRKELASHGSRLDYKNEAFCEHDEVPKFEEISFSAFRGWLLSGVQKQSHGI